MNKYIYKHGDYIYLCIVTPSDVHTSHKYMRVYATGAIHSNVIYTADELPKGGQWKKTMFEL